jgi:uroporphyrin-3 C-methyltransferase
MSENETEIIHSPKEPKQPVLRSSFWANVGVLFSAFGAIVLVVVMILASYGLLTVSECIARAVSYLTHDVAQLQANVQKDLTDIQQTVQQNNTTLKTQADAITELQKLQRTNKDDFLVAEASYLVKLANENLQFQRNIPAAIKLLQSADQNIAKITDTRIYKVREALAKDILALQNAVQVDVTGIYLRLSTLNEQIDKLPILNAFVTAKAQEAFEKNNEKAAWWRRGLNNLSQALQHIVIVRHTQPNVRPFIAADQQVFLYQNLHSELEKAEWGLLHQKSDIYRQSLQQAENWIKQYIVQTSPITEQTIANLQELQKIDINPAVPTVTNSLQLLQTYNQ